MIFRFIGICIVLYSLSDYKRAFLLYLVFKIMLVGNIALFSIRGHTLTLDLFMTVAFWGIYLLKGKRYHVNREFPFKTAFYLIAISWVLSSFFAIAGFRTIIIRTISNIFSELIIVYLIWQIVDREEDFRFLFKAFTIVFAASCIYGFFEFFIQSNPLAIYEQSLVNTNNIRDFFYSSTDGRGYRVQSFFEHAIGAGINWSLYVIWFFSALFKTNWKIPNRLFASITVVLCLLSLFITKSRAPIVFILIGSCSFVSLRKRKFYIIAICVISMAAIIFPILSSYVDMNIIASIFNSSVRANVSGSNVAMRLEQLEASIYFLGKNPLFGQGIKFTEYSTDSLLYKLRGLESIWFVTITYYGIIGLFAQLYFTIGSLNKTAKIYNCKVAAIIMLTYWFTYTLTTLPGMLTYMLYIVLFFHMKRTSYYIKDRGKCCCNNGSG